MLRRNLTGYHTVLKMNKLEHGQLSKHLECKKQVASEYLQSGSLLYQSPKHINLTIYWGFFVVVFNNILFWDIHMVKPLYKPKE